MRAVASFAEKVKRIRAANRLVDRLVDVLAGEEGGVQHG